MSEVAIEQRINNFFRRFVLRDNLGWRSVIHFSMPPSIRPRDYDRTAIMRLIHECMGLPASPPVTSEESEVDGDSPPTSRSTTTVTPVPIQPSGSPQPTIPSQETQQYSQPIPTQVEQSTFNPQLIRIDERTLQLHFTPLYFGKFHH